MSEKLLKAIIKLLVIVAKEEGVVDEREKQSVEDFLIQNVSREDTQHYLKLLDKYINEITTESGDDKTAIQELADSINNEVTREQKMVILLRSMELIIADQKITDREAELLYHIGECFNFSKEVVEEVRHFVLTRDLREFSYQTTVIAKGAELDSKLREVVFKRFKGFIVFFKVPDVEIYFLKYYGSDALILNGAEIAPGKIKIFPNGSSMKGKKTDRLYFSDVVAAYRQESAETKISFVAEDITFKFPGGKTGLVNINISEGTGRLFGIMGGSGAGKSTLFNVLNGTAKPSSGSVRINSIDIYKEPKKVEGLIGFVPQDDLLIEDLTVYQNLYYAAKLCFKSYSKNELDELVTTTLHSLGLFEARDLKVGNPLQKTISGGQRKRLNIGLELLREPSVMFVDEPTSGLSSRDSENIMDLLKELSLRGKMVFVVIHQPSSEIFKMFDKLLILDVGGHEIYYGNPVEAVTYFKEIVDMIDKDQGACIECGNVNPEQIFNIIETKVVDEYGRFTNKRKYTAKQWHEQFQSRFNLQKEKEVEEIPEKNISIPGNLKQIAVFIERDILSKISNKQYVWINLLEAPALALILAIITKFSLPGSEYTFYDNENVPVFFFMSIIVALFMGLTVSAEEIIKDRKILKRESFLNLSRTSYLSSKTLILFTMSAIQTLLFIVVGAWILEIQGMTLWYWIILFSVSCFANILGLNISSAFNSVITVYILIPLLIIPQLILSGVVVNFDKLNDLFSSEKQVPIIGEIMASRWAYEALAVTQYRDNPYNAQYYDYNRTISTNTYKSLYHIKTIKELLDFCNANPDHPRYEEELDLIRNEIKKELRVFGADKFPEVDQINAEEFNLNVYDKARTFLGTLQNVYNQRRKEAKEQLDALFASQTATEELKAEHDAFQKAYANDRISLMVRNIGTKRRVVESDGELVQKVYPVYAKNLTPNHPLDFRTNFYYPEKFFMGNYIDTKVFNVMVIWSMTIVLFIALYFDVLKKLVGGRD